MKTITMRRSELVWETRTNTWTETDWTNLLQWMKERIEDRPEDDWFKINFGPAYDAIKNLTWGEVVDNIESDKIITWDIVVNKGLENEYHYTESLDDFIKEQMREENYDCDICNTEYADDYEEKITLGEQD